jgi:hypothetical protein
MTVTSLLKELQKCDPWGEVFVMDGGIEVETIVRQVEADPEYQVRRIQVHEADNAPVPPGTYQLGEDGYKPVEDAYG